MPHEFDAIFRMVVTGTLHSQQWNVVWHFRTKEGTPSETLLEDTDALLSDFNISVKPSFKNCSSQEVQLTMCHVTCLTHPATAQSVSYYTNEAGALVGQALPAYCAVVLSWRTAEGGRSGHGRTYMPGITETGSEGSFINNTQMTLYSNFCNALLNRWGISGSSPRFRFVVYSKKMGATRVLLPFPHYTYSPDYGNPIRSVVIKNTIFTQRHRLLGKGV